LHVYSAKKVFVIRASLHLQLLWFNYIDIGHDSLPVPGQTPSFEGKWRGNKNGKKLKMKTEETNIVK